MPVDFLLIAFCLPSKAIENRQLRGATIVMEIDAVHESMDGVEGNSILEHATTGAVFGSRELDYMSSSIEKMSRQGIVSPSRLCNLSKEGGTRMHATGGRSRSRSSRGRKEETGNKRGRGGQHNNSRSHTGQNRGDDNRTKEERVKPELWAAVALGDYPAWTSNPSPADQEVSNASLTQTMKDTARKCNVKSGNNIVTFSCELPPEKIGSLIGSGGDHIQQVRSKTGATIIVSNFIKKGRTQTLTVEGPPLSAYLAHALLMKRYQETKQQEMSDIQRQIEALQQQLAAASGGSSKTRQ